MSLHSSEFVDIFGIWIRHEKFGGCAVRDANFPHRRAVSRTPTALNLLGREWDHFRICSRPQPQEPIHRGHTRRHEHFLCRSFHLYPLESRTGIPVELNSNHALLST